MSYQLNVRALKLVWRSDGQSLDSRCMGLKVAR